MAPQIKDDLQQKELLPLANTLEDQTISIFETELLANYTGSGNLSITELTTDRGTLGKKINGKWSFEPEENYNGTVALTYVVTDENGSINGSHTFQITPTNDPPKDTGDQFKFSDLETNSSLIFSSTELLQGYSDIDGDTLSISDLEVDKGKLSQTGASWTYTPDRNQIGKVKLTYAVMDGNGQKITVSNSFEVVQSNNKPVLTGEQATLKSGTEDASYTLRKADLLEGFTDADGDDLSVLEIKANNGKITKISDDSWTFNPNSDYFGTVDINYRVADSNSNSIAASNSFSLKNVNDAPSLTGERAELDSGKINRVIELKSSDLLFGYSDIEGNQLSIKNLRTEDGEIRQNNDQTWTLTPKNDFTGTAKLTYNVSDGNGGLAAATQSVEILSFNNNPLKTGGTTSFNQSNSNFKARTSDNSAILIRSRDLLKGYSDPDGDQLSISGLQTSGGSLEQNNDDTWWFTPDRDSSKLVELSYTINDSQGGSLFVSNTIFNEEQKGNRRTGTGRRDILSGTRGNDDLTGLRGHDKISGLDGDDVLDGGAGKDQLKGGQGDDELIGGKGKDRLWGNGGNDLFIVKRGAGYDVIADFDPNDDLIQVGEGLREIEITSRKGDALIYQDDDLIAKVKGMGDSISLSRDLVM